MNTNRTQILHVNSSNRVSGKPNDFVITIPDSFIQNSDFDNTKIVVEPIQCVLPRAWDGVNSYNNTFTFYNVTDDMSKTITIPCGNYNVYNFLLVLEHSLCCAEPFMVIGYDKLLNKFLFMTPKNNKVYQLIFNGNYSAFFLGFEPNDIITLDFTKGAIYSKNTVRMNLSTVILLHSDLPKTTNSAIDNLLSSSVQESDIFLKMPIDKPPYDTLIWRSQSTDIVSFEMQHANITKVRFYLTDEYSIPIPLEYDFTFSLRFTYVDLSAQDTLLNKIDRITQYLNYLVLEKTSKKHKKISIEYKMGFFNRVRNFASKAFGAVGHVVKHFGGAIHNIAKGIGTYLPVVADAGALVAAGLGAPEVALGIEGISKVVTLGANAVAGWTENSHDIGNHLTNASNYIAGS